MMRRVTMLLTVLLLAGSARSAELAVVGQGGAFGAGAGVHLRQPVAGDVYALIGVGHAVDSIDGGGGSRRMPTPMSCHTLSWRRRGSVRDTNVGLGLGIERPLPAGWRGRCEGGWSYHALDSGVVSEVRWDDRMLARNTFCVGDTQTLDVGASLVRPLGAKVRLLVGGGYRWDLDPQVLTDQLGYASDMAVDLTGWQGFVGVGIQLR